MKDLILLVYNSLPNNVTTTNNEVNRRLIIKEFVKRISYNLFDSNKSFYDESSTHIHYKCNEENNPTEVMDAKCVVLTVYYNFNILAKTYNYINLIFGEEQNKRLISHLI